MAYPKNDEEPKKPIAPAVDQAAKLLTCLGESGSSMNLTQICKKIGIHKSKGYSILNSLMQYNFVIKDPVTKSYSLGPGILSLAKNIQDNMDINSIARPYLRVLANETRSAVLLGTISNDQFFITSKYEGDKTISVTVRQYETLHITHGAHGKAIMAFSSPEEQKRLLNLTPSCFYGKNKNFDVEDLYQEINLCRRTGYAIDPGMVTEGIIAVSTPIFDHLHKICAAIVVLGTFAENLFETYGKKTAETGTLISRELGAKTPYDENR